MTDLAISTLIVAVMYRLVWYWDRKAERERDAKRVKYPKAFKTRPRR